VLGGPGSGKGTQCARIVEQYGFQHLSAGDLLREEVASGSKTGAMIDGIIKDGKLVPMEVTIGLLRAAMVRAAAAAHGARDFLIDGFPRALDQGARFEEMVKPCEFVFFFDCPEDVMEARLLKRGETSGRVDDNAESIKKRFRTFVDQSLPVIERYEGLGKCERVSATQTPDEVFVHVSKALEARLGVVAAKGGAVAAPAPAAKKQQAEEKQQDEAVVAGAAPALAFA
jgi:UMP-CMP kinase